MVVFYSDMIRQIKVPCQMDFMWLSSYSGTNSTGELIVRRDVSVDIKDRHVLILEDIYDTGTSLDFTYRHLMSKGPASLKICTLLDKPERRKPGITLKPDYVGFTIPNEFVVGYGLDYNEHFRNLPYVGVLKPKPRAVLEEIVISMPETMPKPAMPQRAPERIIVRMMTFFVLIPA